MNSIAGHPIVSIVWRPWAAVTLHRPVSGAEELAGLNVLSTLYAAIARRRREFYAARPDFAPAAAPPGDQRRQHRRGRPRQDADRRVLVARVVRTWVSARRSSAAATRRRKVDDGVVVVRDPDGIRADLDRSGDEPLMLARQLPGRLGAGRERSLSCGLFAERHLGATVHVLDDGFQHLQLDRDVDLVIVAARTSRLMRADAAGRPFARASRHAARRRRRARRRRARVRARPAAAKCAVRGLPHAARDGGAHSSGQPREGSGSAVGRWPSPASRGRRTFSRDCARPGTTSPGHADLRDHHRYSRGGPRPGRPRRQGRRRGSPADHGEGLRPPAAVPAVSDAGRVGAPYNGTGSTAGVPPLAGRRARRRPRPVATDYWDRFRRMSHGQHGQHGSGSVCCRARTRATLSCQRDGPCFPWHR